MNEFYLKAFKTLVEIIAKNAGSPPKTEIKNFTPVETSLPQYRAQGSTTCIPCSIDHTATACGVLNESLRFARRDSIANPEVQLRIAKAEEELNTMERLDLDAHEIARLPEKQRQITGWLAVQSKNLRDRLKSINSLTDLEAVAADACKVRLEFRARSLGLPEELADISTKFEKGELDAKEAREKIHELVGTEKK